MVVWSVRLLFRWLWNGLGADADASACAFLRSRAADDESVYGGSAPRWTCGRAGSMSLRGVGEMRSSKKQARSDARPRRLRLQWSKKRRGKGVSCWLIAVRSRVTARYGERGRQTASSLEQRDSPPSFPRVGDRARAPPAMTHLNFSAFPRSSSASA